MCLLKNKKLFILKMGKILKGNYNLSDVKVTYYNNVF